MELRTGDLVPAGATMSTRYWMYREFPSTLARLAPEPLSGTNGVQVLSGRDMLPARTLIRRLVPAGTSAFQSARSHVTMARASMIRDVKRLLDPEALAVSSPSPWSTT